MCCHSKKNQFTYNIVANFFTIWRFVNEFNNKSYDVTFIAENHLIDSFTDRSHRSELARKNGEQSPNFRRLEVSVGRNRVRRKLEKARPQGRPDQLQRTPRNALQSRDQGTSKRSKSNFRSSQLLCR